MTIPEMGANDVPLSNGEIDHAPMTTVTPEDKKLAEKAKDRGNEAFKGTMRV